MDWAIGADWGGLGRIGGGRYCATLAIFGRVGYLGGFYAKTAEMGVILRNRAILWAGWLGDLAGRFGIWGDLGFGRGDLGRFGIWAGGFGAIWE